jgi:hypothetical protein
MNFWKDLLVTCSALKLETLFQSPDFMSSGSNVGMGENSIISRSLHYQLDGLASVLTRFLKSDGHCSTANGSVKCKSVLGNSAVNC